MTPVLVAKSTDGWVLCEKVLVKLALLPTTGWVSTMLPFTSIETLSTDEPQAPVTVAVTATSTDAQSVPAVGQRALPIWPFTGSPETEMAQAERVIWSEVDAELTLPAVSATRTVSFTHSGTPEMGSVRVLTGSAPPGFVTAPV